MSTKYFALLTQLGADKLANATALGTKIEITHMAVGDGGGSLPTPDTKQTKLVNEKRRAAINVLNIDPKNTNQIMAEQVIPESEGGWWIREIGLFDNNGILIAVGNCAETYKPQLQEGSGRTQTIRMVLIVSHTDAVTLKIDPSVVLATREYADSAVANAIREHEQSRRHPDATLKAKGFVMLSNATDSNAENVAATSKAVKTIAEASLAKAQNGADILDKPAFVKNLGLTAGSALPVGVPIPWPLATPPAGWIKCNGATFTAAQYPELARVYPSLRLPDLRGEFIRGWDDSGKIDPGRHLLSLQTGSVGRHDHAFNQTWGATGPDSTGGRYPVSADTNGAVLDIPIYTDYSGGNETRPRNIAFNYIVRAV